MIPNCFTNNEFAILQCDLRWRSPLLTWFFLREFHIFPSPFLLKVFHIPLHWSVKFLCSCFLCFFFPCLCFYSLSFFLCLSASSGSSLLLIAFSMVFSFFLKLPFFLSSIWRLLLLYSLSLFSWVLGTAQGCTWTFITNTPNCSSHNWQAILPLPCFHFSLTKLKIWNNQRNNNYWMLQEEWSHFEHLILDNSKLCCRRGIALWKGHQLWTYLFMT